MIENIIILLIVLALLGILYTLFDEMQDESVNSSWRRPLQFLFWKLSLKFLNKKESVDNKWFTVDGKKLPYEKRWYHFGVKPTNKEKFPFSSTFAVALTDGEHFFQLLKNKTIIVGILLIHWPSGLAWFVGNILMTFIKEKWIKWLR